MERYVVAQYLSIHLDQNPTRCLTIRFTKGGKNHKMHSRTAVAEAFLEYVFFRKAAVASTLQPLKTSLFFILYIQTLKAMKPQHAFIPQL